MKYKLTSLEEDLINLGLLPDSVRYKEYAQSSEYLTLDPWNPFKKEIKEQTTSANAGGGFPAGGPFINGEMPLLTQLPKQNYSGYVSTKNTKVKKSKKK